MANPTTIGTGLSAWGDATAALGHIVLDGSSLVDYWGDLTQDAVLRQPSSGDAPAVGTSGPWDAVVFDGTDWLVSVQSGSLGSGFTPGAAPYSYMLYLECTGAASSWHELCGQNSAYMQIYGADDLLHWEGTSQTVAFAKNTRIAVGGVGNGSSSSQWKDGTKIGTATCSGGDASDWRLGGPFNKPAIKMIRFAFYEAALSDGDMGSLSTWATNGDVAAGGGRSYRRRVPRLTYR